MKHFILLVIVVFSNLKIVYSQEIQITNINLKGDKVEVYYNLIDERIDRSYSINLYTSKDNFIQPMEMVKGDAGIDLSVGANKVLIWDAKGELGDDFDGSIALELKGNYYVPFITVDGIQTGKEFKRTKNHDLIWAGGRGDNVLNFELYRGENLVKSFEERPNIGNTSLAFPRVKPGDDYKLRISDSNNRDEVVFTNTFIIKRKYPLGAQLGVAFIIGAGVGFLINSLIPEKENVISEPPLPTR